MKTVIGIFDEGSDLSGVLNKLEDANIKVERVVENEGDMGNAAGRDPSTPRGAGMGMPGAAVAGQGGAVAPAGLLGLFDNLDVPDDEQEYLDNSVAHGGKLIILKANGDEVGRAVDILEANGASRVHDPRA